MQKEIRKVAFISPQKIYPLDESSKKAGPTPRPNVSVPALIILGMLKTQGYETFFVDAVAEAPDELHKIKEGLFRVGLSNDEIATKLKDFSPDVILISSMFALEYYLVNELATTLKKYFPKSKIIVGGNVATNNPEWHLECKAIDFAVFGEGGTIIDLLKEFEEEKPEYIKIPNFSFRNSDAQIVKTKISMQKSESPSFDYDSVLLLPNSDYRYDDKITSRTKAYRFNVNEAQTRSCVLFGSRGCPIGCDYCGTRMRDGRIIRHMGAERMFEDLKMLHKKYRITIFYNQADTFGLHPEDKKFFELVADYRKQNPEIVLNNPNAFFVSLFVNPDFSVNKEFIQLLKDSGFNVVTLAIETFIQRFNKKIDFSKITFEKIIELCEYIKSLGMKIDIFAMYCFPSQTEEELLFDIERFKQLKEIVDDFSLVNLVFFPGTLYYSQAIKNGNFTEEEYKREIRNGFSFHHLTDFFNLSQIKTERIKEIISELEDDS